MENRITELEQMVKNAVIIDESELSVDSVSVGTHVSIKMIGDDEAEEYDIVGRTEADPINGKISDESPVGHALLGKAVGEKAEVLLPSARPSSTKCWPSPTPQTEPEREETMEEQKRNPAQGLSESEQVQVRRQKLADLQAAGNDPFT